MNDKPEKHMNEGVGIQAFFGIGAPLGAIAVSNASQVEQWLRIAALFGSVAVSVATFFWIVQKVLYKWQLHRKDKKL